MTSPASDPMAAPAPAKPTSRWEDFIDIFTSPTSVFERRQNQSPWPMIWIVTIILTVVTVLTFNGYSSVVESEFRAAVVKAMAKNPQMTADIVDKQIGIQIAVRKWATVFFPIVALIGALFIWLVAKIVGSKSSYQGALVVMAYSSVVVVVQAIVTGAQALIMDVSSMTSMDQLSLSAARFVDKATMSPVVYGLLKQLDIFGIWGLVITVIGVQVTGKISRQQAITFGVIWFVLVTLLQVAGAMWTAAAAG